MNLTKPGSGQLIAGAGGVLLIVSLFLPWADAGGVDRSGFELWTMADVFFLIVGIVAIAAVLTGGRFGLFRPDLSLNGATDLLGVVGAILVSWLILFDFPSGASREVGVFLALIGVMAVAGGAGDYNTLRGAPLFPRIDSDEPGLHRTIPALPVRDVAAAAAHYREHFGFEARHEAADFAVLVHDNAVLHLWGATDVEWRSRDDLGMRPVSSGAESFLAGTASCRIEVADVDGLFDEFEREGVLHDVSRDGVEQTEFGTREFATVDLDGNLLTFLRWEG